MVFVLEIIGTVAFAFSGCMVANARRMDIFGVWVLGTVTAVGGGAIRDLLLGITPPSMFRDGTYVAVATATVAVWLLVAAHSVPMTQAMFDKISRVMEFSDSIGLGVFAVVGCQTAILNGHGDNRFLVLFMGVLTGVGGGLLRDVIADTTPVIFRKRIYAIAALAGSAVYVILLQHLSEAWAVVAGAATVFVIRTLASIRRWDLPVFVLEQAEE